MQKDLYFTHVEALGSLILMWAQCDKKTTEMLSRNIQSVSHLLEMNVIDNPLQQLTSGKLCLLKIKGNEYYRVKILSVAKLQQKLVSVFLLDYGNTFEVRVDSLRLIDNLNPFITQAPNMASHFFLADVQPPTGNTWPPTTIEFVRQTLTNKAFRCHVSDVEPVGNLIHIYVSTEPPLIFSSILVAKNLATPIAAPHQQSLIQALSQQVALPVQNPVVAPAMQAPMHVPSVPAIPTINHVASITPIPAVMALSNVSPVSPMSTLPTMSPLPILRRQSPAITVSQYTSVKLQIGSRHAVYISHVEDGVFSFAVQLKVDADEILPNFMLEINEGFQPEPVQGLLMPGSLCLARYTGDKAICRAVVTDVIEDKVKVFYVDFGNWEELPPSEVFAIPPKLLTQKVMASKFALAGIKDDPDFKQKAVKDYFHQFSGDKEFVMDVKPNETSSFMQYCDLYYSGHNIKDLLKREMDKIIPFAYSEQPLPAIGTSDDVVVTFVESPMRFFVQLSKFQEDLNTVMSCIASFCNSAKGSSGLFGPDDADLNLPCCAFFDGDSKWYRAQILENSDPNALVVRYVDFGNEETVVLNSLRRIEKKLVTEFSIQAIQCCLKGFESASFLSDDGLIAYFESETLEQTFTMKVLGAISPKVLLVDLINSKNQSLSALLKNFKAAPEVEEVPVALKTEPVQNHVNDGNVGSDDWNDTQNYQEQQVPCSEDNWRKPRNNDSKNNWRNRDDNAGDRKYGGFNKFNDRSNRDNFTQNNDNMGFKKPFDRDSGFKKSFDRDNDYKKPYDRDNDYKKPYDRDNDYKKPYDRDNDYKKPYDRHDDFKKPFDHGFKGRNKDSGFQNRNFNKDDNCSGQNQNSNANNDDWSSGQVHGDNNFGGRDKRKPYGESKSNNDFNPPKSTDDWDAGSSHDSHHGSHNFEGGHPKRFDGERKFGGERKFEKRGGDHFESKPWKDRDSSSRPYKPRKQPGFPAGSSYTRVSLEVGTEIEVHVPWFVSPGEFHVQLLNSHSDFRTMMNTMQQEYSKRETADSNSLNTGDCIVAKSAEDKVVYRAQIKESSFGTFKVEFVDFGNCEDVDSNAIWTVSNDHCDLPCQAVPCSLNGIAPADESNEWSKDALAKIVKFFKGDKYLCTVVSFDEEQNLYFVNLLNVNDNTDVAQQLIAEGVAVSTLLEPASLESEDPVDLSLLVNQTLWAHMCAVVCKSQFFVHLEKRKVDAIQTAVDAYVESFNESETPKLAEEKIKLGEYCIASPDNETWYRAQITDLNGTAGVIVTFIDYGDSADVTRDSLCAIHDDLLVSPGQAVECCLPENATVDNEKFENYMGNDDTAFIIHVKSIDENGKLCVNVFDRSGLDLFCQSGETVNPFCRLPILRQRENVSLIHAEDNEPESFIVLHYAAYADALAEFLDVLHEYAESAEALTEVEGDEICVAKSVADEQWYRAKILTSEPEITVEYLDYGNTEVVPQENLRKSDSKLAYPPLFAVRPIYLPISNFAASELLETYADTNFTANFKLYDNKWFADLETDGVNICSALIESGKAEGLSPSPYSKSTSALLRWQALNSPPEQKVVCTYVDNINFFFLQLAAESERLNKLQADLQHDVSKMMPLVGKPDVFAAKYVVDDTWYRAEFSSDEMVRFIDYGNEDARDEIKKLSVKYLEEGHFSVACSLPIIPVEGTEWSEEIIDKFRSLLEAEELYGKILSVEENIASVKLTIDGKDVSDILIEEGLAVAKPVVLPVSHINSLTKFYIQQDLPACDKMAENLVSAESWSTLDCLAEGLIVAAKFDDDELFYRASVLELTENVTKVLFIDYGNSAVTSEIRELPDNLKSIKPLATECSFDLSVSLIAPETVDKFKEISNFGETYFTLKVIRETDDKSIVDLLLEGESVMEQLMMFNDQSIEVAAKTSHINSPTSFYIQYIRDETTLNEVADALLTANEFEQISECTEGLILAAKFEDEAYYRAKVLSDTKVFFIDFGNIASSDDLRILPESIINIPPLAKHCALQLPEDVEAFPVCSQEILDMITGGHELKVKYLNFDEPRLVVAELNGQNVVDLLLQISSPEQDPTEIILSDDSSCAVSHINSPSDFYIQKDGENLDTVTNVLNECALLKPVQIEEITVGSVVAAKFVEDTLWYRAEVLSKDETTDGYCVLFIDFGNTSVATEFAEIPEAIFEVPPLALKFSLKLPAGCSEWPEKVKTAFTELLEANEFKCEILGDEESGVIDLKCDSIIVSEELAKSLSSGATDDNEVKVKLENDDVIPTENECNEVSEGLEAEIDDDSATKGVNTENDESSMVTEESTVELESKKDKASETNDGHEEKLSMTLEDAETERISTPCAEDASLSEEYSGIEYSPADISEKNDAIIQETKNNDPTDVADVLEKVDAMNIEANETADTTAESIEFVKECDKPKEIIDLSPEQCVSSAKEKSVSDSMFSVEDLDDCERNCTLEDVNCSFKSIDAIDDLKSVASSKMESESEESDFVSPERRLKDNTLSDIHSNGSIDLSTNVSKLSADVDYDQLSGLAIKKELNFDGETTANDPNSSKTIELDDSSVSFSSQGNSTVIEVENSSGPSKGTTSPSRIKSVAEDKIVPGSINKGDLSDPPTLTRKLPHEERIVPGIISDGDLSTLLSASEASTDDECSNTSKTSEKIDLNNFPPVYHKPIPLDEKLCAQALKPLEETPQPVAKIPQDEKILPFSMSGVDISCDKEVS